MTYDADLCVCVDIVQATVSYELRFRVKACLQSDRRRSVYTAALVLSFQQRLYGHGLEIGNWTESATLFERSSSFASDNGKKFGGISYCSKLRHHIDNVYSLTT
jgi:hypothetical protein